MKCWCKPISGNEKQLWLWLLLVIIIALPKRMSWELAATSGLCPFVTQGQGVTPLLTNSLGKAYDRYLWRVDQHSRLWMAIHGDPLSFSGSEYHHGCTADKKTPKDQPYSFGGCLIYTNTHVKIKSVFMLTIVLTDRKERTMCVLKRHRALVYSQGKKKQSICLGRGNGLSLNILHKTKKLLFAVDVNLF